ncbi:hypothetical protein AO379_1833 [Moraxella catarrhalis]|nr:hypothetical protein AO379_1833 [Moraxella catarrhalis]
MFLIIIKLGFNANFYPCFKDEMVALLQFLSNKSCYKSK